MASKEIDVLNSMEGERGIPSANETGGISRSQKLTFVLLVMVSLSILFGLLYYNRQKSAVERQNNAALADNSPPTKTFELPPMPKPALPTETSVPAAAPALPAERQQIAAPSEPLLDKSSTSLMTNSTRADNATPDGADSSAAPSVSGSKRARLELSTASLIGERQRNLLIAKGAFLDCALQTKLVSTVQGMTACVLTRNVYSDNGKVLLLERGSQVIGEYKSSLNHGQARIFVLWTRIKTPHGVIIDIESPGTDPLGGSGLPGYVDTHFWQRFGGAIMLSLLDDGLAYIAKSSGNQANHYESSQANTQNLASETLRNTINIPPTLYINQGTRINIYVAKDLDFSGVYDVQRTH